MGNVQQVPQTSPPIRRRASTSGVVLRGLKRHWVPTEEELRKKNRLGYYNSGVPVRIISCCCCCCYCCYDIVAVVMTLCCCALFVVAVVNDTLLFVFVVVRISLSWMKQVMMS